MKPYVGMKENAKAIIFEADNPTKETHPQFDAFCGPFKTIEDAARYVRAMDQGIAVARVSL